MFFRGIGRKPITLVAAAWLTLSLFASACSNDSTTTPGDTAGTAAGAAQTGSAGTGAGANSGASASSAATGGGAKSGTGATGAAGTGTVGSAGKKTTGGSGGKTTPTAGKSGGNAGKAGGAAGGASVAKCSFPASTAPASGSPRGVIVDAAQISGAIHSLQGVHWDPGVKGGATSNNYKAMGVDMIRTHDASGIGGTGTGDIDVTGTGNMFRNMAADSTQESSYSFGPTDQLIKNILDVGATVYFRVGRSNIGMPSSVPADFDKYADIVKHVVMHYNKGWANGFNYGIKYFEIWNEPDFIPFWAGTGDQYHELYGKIALAIKEADPEAIIGGPANASFNDEKGTRGSFMKYCKDNKLPLDFFSYHKYSNHTNDPYEHKRMAEDLLAELATYGFTKTTIINSEWWTSLVGEVVLGGVAGQAAFLAQALIYQQPVHEKSFVYAMFGGAQSKISLAFGAVSKLNATPQKLCTQTQGGEDNGFAVMAGSAASGQKLQVVIASYQISTTLMGDSVLEENIVVTNMSYLPRRTITYPETEGYALTIKGIPDSWGDVTVNQYRIDATNDNKLTTKVVKASERTGGNLTVSGTGWVRAAPGAGDPKGAPQGVDLIEVTGSGAK